jgi:hypothetical protein
MAEEQPDFQPQGHQFDPGPVLLDLHRLLCAVLADPRVAKLVLDEFDPIWALRQEHLRTEVTRIMVSSAVALRIVFDRENPKIFKKLKTDCGKLYPDWAGKKQKVALSLREACNKIIHATEIRFDVVSPRGHLPHYPGSYIRPQLYLYGKKDKLEWRAKLSLIDFVKQAARVLLMAHGLR